MNKYKNNLRIVGGVPAVAYSWPAQVLIIMNYQAIYTLPSNQNKTIAIQVFTVFSFSKFHL